MCHAECSEESRVGDHGDSSASSNASLKSVGQQKTLLGVTVGRHVMPSSPNPFSQLWEKGNLWNCKSGKGLHTG